MLPVRRRFFYGWLVLATCFFVMAVAGGGIFYAFGVFLKPMTDEFGGSRGAGSIAFSLSSVCMAFAAPLVGAAVSRFGARKVMTLGQIILVLSLALLSQINQLWQLYVVFGVMVGVSQGFATFLPAMTIINNWFIRRRAMAMGITSCGVGVGTFILAPFNRYLIETVGWRAAWIVLGAVAVVFALIPVLLFVRGRPEEMGQRPDGDRLPLEENDNAPSRGKATVAPVDWDTASALRTPALWLVVVFSCANIFTLNIISTHQVAHLEDIGIAPMVAAGALGLLAIVSAAGRLVGGTLGDRFELRYIAAAVSVLQLGGLLIFMNAREIGLLYAYVIIYGPAYGAALVLTPAIIGAYFGRRNFPAIFGISSAIYSIVGATSPILAGYMYDSLGSYRIPLIIAAAFSAVGGVCVFMARPPLPPPEVVNRRPEAL
jgi:MFS family permease